MAFSTPDEQFSLLKSKVEETIRGYFPIETSRSRLVLEDVEVSDTLSSGDLRSQRDALKKQKTWAVPVHATLRVERNGKVIDRKRVLLMRLPKITQRYGYIVDGNELQSLNQFRQRPGVYHFTAQDGRVRARFNLKNRDQLANGRSFRINLDPKTGVFMMEHDEANPALYPLLKGMGVSDEEMEGAWGRKVLEENKKRQKLNTAWRSLAKKVEGAAPKNPAEKAGLFGELLQKTELDPETTRATLGRAATTVDADVILRATKNLLGITRGVREEDNHTGMEFQSIHSFEDLLTGQLKKAASGIRRKILRKLDRARTVQQVFSREDTFDRAVRSFFRTSLVDTPEQTNPLEMVAGHMKTTIMGEQGGLKSTHAVMEDSKLVNPSNLGFLDPIHTPEGEMTGVTLHLPLGARKKGNRLLSVFVDPKTGRRVELDAGKALSATVAFPDQYRRKDGKLTPRGQRIKATRAGEVVFVGPGEVDFILPSPRGVFGIATNLIPFLQNNQGNRAMTAARQQEQAVPLKFREAPLVQAQTDGRATYEDVMGKVSASYAPVEGQVVEIKDDAVVIQSGKKKREVQFYRDFPLKGHTLYNSDVRVKKGDRVKKGQLLADSTFTRDGTLALGTNLRTAYMPFHGYNFEDGIVVSESAAQKLTSLHGYEKKLGDDAETVIRRGGYLTELPHQFIKRQLENISDEGIVRVGATVEPGDPLILALRKPSLSAQQEQVRSFRKGLVKWRDASLVWNVPYKGKVTDVFRRKNRQDKWEWVVAVKTEEPAQIGDKVVGRHGNKGVITRILPDAQMPYKEGEGGEKEHVQILLNPLGVPGRINLGQILETVAAKIAKERGEVYKVRNFEAGKNYLEDIKKELDQEGLTDKEELIDPETGKPYGQKVLTGDQYILKLRHQVRKKMSARSGSHPGATYDVNDSPKSGAPAGGQALGELGMYSMLAHGARENLHEMYSYKCLTGVAEVETDQGPVPIGKVVNGKLPVSVKTVDSAGNIVWRRVVNYWKYSLPDQMVKVTYTAFVEGGRPTRRTLYCTPGHKLCTPRGKVPVSALGVEDCLLTEGVRLTPDQRQILLGSLLGDGSLGVSARLPAYQERHVVRQREYLAFKKDALASLPSSDLREYDASHEGSSAGQRMVEWRTGARAELAPFYKLFYGTGERRYPKQVFEELDLLGFAICYLDDGSTSVLGRATKVPYLSIAARSLNDQEQEWAREAIARLFGVSVRISKGYIYFNVKESRKVLDMIAPYFHPSMACKAEGFAEVGGALEALDLDSEKTAVENLIGSVDWVSKDEIPDRHGAHVYDIEVEDTHTYFVDGTLSSNSGKNRELWDALRNGTPLPAPQVPLVYKKFESYLNALRVNIDKQGNELQLIPFTEEQVLAMSNGELKDPGVMFRAKDMQPLEGGLFDERITGGRYGEMWSHFKLPEPMPNPMFESAILKLTDLKEKEFRKILRGDQAVDGKYGGAALEAMLEKVDVDGQIDYLTERIRTHKTARGPNHDKLRILKALKAKGLKPTVYMMRSVPVVPPKFRPVTEDSNGNLTNEDINFLYKGVGASIDAYNTVKSMEVPGVVELPQDYYKAPREEMYDGLRAFVGTGGNLAATRDYAGLLDVIAGKVRRFKQSDTGTGKNGYFQRRLIKRRQDFSARSIIIPEPRLGLDELGLPEDIAWAKYRPFIERALMRQGLNHFESQEAWEKRAPSALNALERAMEERPVFLKRDPALHKFNVMAFKPRLVRGKAIQIHPLVTSGYNADFDGDAMSTYLPITPKAVLEARSMFPSSNLFSSTTGGVMYTPGHEALLGLYLLSVPGKRTGKEFASIPEALRAEREGKIEPTDVITVNGAETTAGRLQIEAVLPEGMRETGKKAVEDMRVFDKRTSKKVLTAIAKNHATTYGHVANTFKDLGNEYSTAQGYSIGLDDFSVINKGQRDKLFSEAEQKASKVRERKLSKKEEDRLIVEIFAEVSEKLDRLNNAHLKENPTNISRMVASGSRGKPEQLQQIVSSPVLVMDAKHRVVPSLIPKSYSEGMDLASYWTTLHGARKGTIQKVQGVRDPGYLSKQILNSSMDQLITVDDCGTENGIWLSINHGDITDRFLARGHHLGGSSFGRNTAVDSALLAAAVKAGKKSLFVRSPLRCEADQGVCKKCSGLDGGGRPFDVGDNIGVIAGQAIGEPSTQLALNAFHGGGLAKGRAARSGGTFARLNQLLQLNEVVPNSTALATKSGKVSKIEDAEQGGKFVFIDDASHFIPSTQTVQFRKGDTVSKGEALGDGPVNPHELLKLTNIEKVQDYIAAEMEALLLDAGGVRRRNIEVLVKSLTSITKIDDPGEHPDWAPYDTRRVSKVRAWNKKTGDKVTHQPYLRGINMLPLEQSEDWMARLNFQRLSNTLIQGAREGWKSNIHGFHPIPALALGLEFGRGREALGSEWKGQY